MRFLLGDNHRVFCDLLQHYMKGRIPVAIVQTVHNHDDFLKALQEQEFDVVAFNLHMPGAGIPGTLQDIAQFQPGTPVAVFADANALSQAIACAKAGALGFIPKTLGADEVLKALKTVLSGDTFLPDFLFDETPRDQIPSSQDMAGLFGQQMTRREFAVLQELCGGKSNKEIGRVLGIAEQTVKIHLQRIFKKMGAKNRADAVRIALNPQSAPNGTPV